MVEESNHATSRRWTIISIAISNNSNLTTIQVSPLESNTYGAKHTPNLLPRINEQPLIAGLTSISQLQGNLVQFVEPAMASIQEKRMKQLILKREAFRRELESLRAFLDNNEGGIQSIAIQRNLEYLEEEYATFRETQCELDDLDESRSMQDRIDLKCKYFQTKARASEMIEEANKRSDKKSRNITTNLLDTSLSYPVELPEIRLPTFSGAYEDWPGFAIQFRSIVHENSLLDDCKRLIYLRSCLTHEAFHTIAPFSNAAVNYSAAWDILERGYNKPAKIVAKHLTELFDIAPLRRTSYRDLQAYASKVESHYKALEALGQPTADTVLLHFLASKLDRETELMWKDRTKSIPFPKLNELLTFVNNRCQVLEPRGSIRQTRGRAFITSQSPSSCPICRGPHKIWICNTFRMKTIGERLVAAEQVSACTNCLRTGHTLSHCTAGSCRICGQRHRTLLHGFDS